MLQSTLEILRRRWADLGLIGAANLVAQILTYFLIAGLLIPLVHASMGARGGMLTRLGVRGGVLAPGPMGLDTREVLALVAGAAGMGSRLAAPVALAALAFMLAGLLGAAARVRRDEPAGFMAFWSEGVSGFVRAFGVTIAFAIGAVLTLVVAGAVFWARSPWGFFVWGLLLVPGVLYGLVYPVYLTTVAGLAVSEAYRAVWVALRQDPGEAAVASVVLIGFAVVYTSVLGMIVRLGILGQVIAALAQLLVLPTVAVYVVERWEARFRKRVRVG
jgi:hypothetical protein